MYNNVFIQTIDIKATKAPNKHKKGCFLVIPKTQKNKYCLTKKLFLLTADILYNNAKTNK